MPDCFPPDKHRVPRPEPKILKPEPKSNNCQPSCTPYFSQRQRRCAAGATVNGKCGLRAHGVAAACAPDNSGSHKNLPVRCIPSRLQISEKKREEFCGGSPNCGISQSEIKNCKRALSPPMKWGSYACLPFMPSYWVIAFGEFKNAFRIASLNV